MVRLSLLIYIYIYISILIILTVSCNRHQINNNRNLGLRNDYGHAYYHPITNYSISYHRPQWLLSFIFHKRHLWSHVKFFFNEKFITSNIRQRIHTQALGKSKSVVKITIDSQSLLLLLQWASRIVHVRWTSVFGKRYHRRTEAVT